jgi:hypothetical protein
MKQLLYTIALLGILGLNACKPTEVKPPDTVDDNSMVKLKFTPEFKGQKMDWLKSQINQSDDTFTFSKVKFLMSNITFEKMNGEFYKVPDAYGFISLNGGPDSFYVKAPKGEYKSIRFYVGLDSAINHGDPLQWGNTHPLSPSINDMHWGWAGGYIFNVVEGNYMKNGVNTPFSFHVATLKNARTHGFIENYTLKEKNTVFFKISMDKYFDNVSNLSLKIDGSTSHSGDIDPLMDKFMTNSVGLFELDKVE